MADKKVTQLNPAGSLTVNDIIALCQDPVTGELLQSTLGALRSFILGGANAGARVYFVSGVPDDSIGVDGDVIFDKAAKNIYSKQDGEWVLEDNYGAPDGGAGKIRFVATYGSGGLSGDGLTYQNDDLIGGEVLNVTVEVAPLVSVAEWGDPPAFDEFDFDTTTGEVKFGDPLPAAMRITILYSF